MTKSTEGNSENSNPVDNYGDYVYDPEMSRDIQTRNILHWNYRNLREIPKEVIRHGQHIKEIYLKRNCIVKLPNEIVKLKNLTNIYLIGNQLTTIPEEIGQLRSLKVLDLSQNLLQWLPASLGDLNELQELLITQNQIKILPSELRRLHKLKFFELSGNQISELDAEIISGLISLEDLAADQNPIRSLPSNISNLRRLRYLSVCRAELECLPALPIYKFGETNFRRERALQTGEVLPTEFLHFRFDGNSKLHYLPVWVPQFYGMGLEYFGCGVADPSRRSSFAAQKSSVPNLIQVRHGILHTLQFDQQIQQLNRPRLKEPCSLMESCLRVAFAQMETKKISKHDVPSNLASLLNNGPSAECFVCTQRIFTQPWILIFSLSRESTQQIIQNRKLRLGVVFFCGSNCASYFLLNGRTLSSQVLTPFCKSIIENEIAW